MTSEWNICLHATSDRTFPSFNSKPYWDNYTQNITKTKVSYFWYETWLIYAVQQKCTFHICVLGMWQTLTCLLELLEKHLQKAQLLGLRWAVCLDDSFTICDVVTATGTRMTCRLPRYPKVNNHLYLLIGLLKLLVSWCVCEALFVAHKRERTVKFWREL